ncbi:hypothetical protein C6988_06800 [Nitrosopumilus sp. b1]|uniref:hypothetical protein n=1 Tax=Nitrosopumilus sp. b1 TaxID=2109907 RepID=UPI0015F70243|nr:hypothetical protein [Nitrosopumilus sp. b1]KAF6242876.1 hypothetical protein C6988_06800 [Nitrosopumilus sp. b1]
MNTRLERKIAEWKLAFYSIKYSQSKDAKILAELIDLAKNVLPIAQTTPNPIVLITSLEKPVRK